MDVTCDWCLCFSLPSLVDSIRFDSIVMIMPVFAEEADRDGEEGVGVRCGPSRHVAVFRLDV